MNETMKILREGGSALLKQIRDAVMSAYAQGASPSKIRQEIESWCNFWYITPKTGQSLRDLKQTGHTIDAGKWTLLVNETEAQFFDFKGNPIDEPSVQNVPVLVFQ